MKSARRSRSLQSAQSEADAAFMASMKDKRCETCGKPAGLGLGFSGKRMELGRWFCSEHADEWRAYQPKEAK